MGRSSVLDNLTPWGWVLLAYGQLVVAYGGYAIYLRWRERRAARKGDKR